MKEWTRAQKIPSAENKYQHKEHNAAVDSSLLLDLEFQNAACLQSAMHHDAGSLSGSSIITTAAILERGYVPVNYIASMRKT